MLQLRPKKRQKYRGNCIQVLLEEVGLLRRLILASLKEETMDAISLIADVLLWRPCCFTLSGNCAIRKIHI